MNTNEKELERLLTPDALRGGDDEAPELKEKAKPREDLSEVEKLLTPKNLIDVVDPLEGTTAGLCPDELRGGDDEEDELKPTRTKTPGEKISDDLKEIQKDATKHFEATDELIEKQEAAIREENAETLAAFKRVVAKRELEGDPLVVEMK